MQERGFALNETPVEKEGSLKVGRGLLKGLVESHLSVELSFWGIPEESSPPLLFL